MENTTQTLIGSGSLFLPEGISAMTKSPDALFAFIFYLSLILFVGILYTLFRFVKKYKATAENPKASKQVTHNNVIEVIWTVIPTIIVLFIFYWGYTDFIKMKTPPGEALEIHVVGKKWLWQFQYPNGKQTIGELVVPKDVPVRLIMSSEDVIHSFFLPNLRMKRDVLPGRYTTIWFNAEKLGNFTIFCTEYCGDAHSNMLAVLQVKTMDDYNAWLESGGADEDTPLPELGKKLYTAKGCNACHSVDGVSGVGPTWQGVFGKTRDFTDGTSAVADENYLRTSIVNPNDKIAAGYAPVMPAYAGILSDREINAIIEYIKTIK